MCNVTGTIRDPAGNPYTSAIIIASFIGQNTTPGSGPYTTGGVPQGQFETVVPGVADSFGAFAMPLAGNDTITPSPSQWKFTVVSSTTPPVSFAVLITIAGASQDISAALQAAAAPLLPASNFSSISVSGLSSLNGGGIFGGLWNKKNVADPSILILENVGTNNAQLIGMQIEQFVSPTVSPAAYFTFGQVTELLIPLGNDVVFTGQQTGTYGTFSHFGSGALTTGFGGGFEGFNPGPATALLIGGVSATANNGGVVTGVPIGNQIPTNNGNAANLRAFDGLVKNWSSGTVTNGAAFYAEAPQNIGGGIITNAYGLFVADMTAGVNNFAIWTGVGKVNHADAVTMGSTASITGPVGIGTAPSAGAGILILSPPLSGNNQFGIQSAVQTTSAATGLSAGGIFRADTPNVAFVQSINVGIYVQTPNKGAASTITEWNGLRVDPGPTAGTVFAIKTAGTEPLSFGGKATTYNALATAGEGLTSIRSVTSQKSESAADANVLTFTPPAVVGSYRVRFTMAVSAQNTATLGWTATWKDANGSAQAPTNLALFTSGTAAPALTVTAATNGNYYGQIDIDTDASATNIVIKLTFTGTSFTAKVTATIERIV